MNMNVKAKIFFKNTVTHTKNEALKLKKLIIINDLLLLKNLPDYKVLLKKYDFYDEDDSNNYFKKCDISLEEWFSLLNGKNIGDFLNNNLENTEDNEFNNSIFKDFLNFFKEIDINEVDNIIIEIFE